MKTMKVENQEDKRMNKVQGKIVEILYQKMGDRWFAFSLIGNEIFVGSISQGEIDKNCLESVPKRQIGNS